MLKVIKPYLLLGFLCLFLYLPGISSIPITDRDEPHYAQTSRQLLETGNYLQLKFQDESRHLKPPGIYWLQVVSVKALSDFKCGEVWPYRVPSVLGALLAVLFTYGFARKQLGERQAFWGAALLASGLFLTVEAHLSLTDTVLLFSVVLMQGALWKIYAGSRGLHWALLFWLAMALGILIKGVGPIFAVLTILGLWVVDRKIVWIKFLHLGWGLALVLALSLAWLLPLSFASHSNFLWDMIYQDVVPKLAGGQQSHGQPPGFFLISSLVMLWPASLLFLVAGFYAWKERKQTNIRFLLAWILPAYFVYECVPTKLPQYLLPIYPALLLLIAAALVNARHLKFPYPKILRIFYVLWLIISLALALAILILLYLVESSIPLLAWFYAAVIVVGACYAFVLAWTQRVERLGLTLVLISFLAFPPLFQNVLPAFSQVWMTEKIRTVLVSQKPSLDEHHPLLALAYKEPSLVFRLGTKNVLFMGDSADETGLAKSLRGASWVLIKQDEQAAFEKKLKALHISMRPVETISGWPLNSGHRISLILYRKG